MFSFFVFALNFFVDYSLAVQGVDVSSTVSLITHAVPRSASNVCFVGFSVDGIVFPL
jgi:hypothetical protein